MPHVNVLDYPDAKPALLKFLAQYRQAIALPGKPLGVTTQVTHYIALQPNTQTTYVPSFRLPHSQKQVVQQKVNELLKEGIIQATHSPWNSPLFGSLKKTDLTVLSLTSARSRSYSPGLLLTPSLDRVGPINWKR